MKKITALFFISLFLFNLFGYRFVIDYLQVKASDQLTAKLDNNLYNDSQLLELKLPIHLPYQSNWSSYERFDGQIEINGVPYQYVKRKVVNDTLYVMCIANDKKLYLEKAGDNYFALSNGNNIKSSGSTKISFNNLGTYDGYCFHVNISLIENKNINNWMIKNSVDLFSFPHTSPDQPPDFCV